MMYYMVSTLKAKVPQLFEVKSIEEGQVQLFNTLKRLNILRTGVQKHTDLKDGIDYIVPVKKDE